MKFALKQEILQKKLKKLCKKFSFLKNRCINIARGVKIAPKNSKGVIDLL